MDALKMAQDLGNVRTVNMIMTGALSKMLDIEESVWLQALSELVPAKHLEVNLKAFALGRGLE